MPSYRLKSYTYLLLVAVLWGMAAPVIKFTLGGIDPLPFLTYRLTVSAVFALIFFLVKLAYGKKFQYLKKNLSLAIIYGLLAVPIALGALFSGLDKSSVLDLVLIGVLGPMMVTAGGAVFFRDRITRKERIGITILLFGVFINSFLPLFSKTGVQITGNFLLIIFLLADSGSVLFAKKSVRNKIKSSNLVNLAFIIGAITLLPVAIYVYSLDGLILTITNLPLKYHLGVWYMAIVSGNLAYFLYVRGQRSIEVSEATLFNYLQPIFTIPLAVFWLKEEITFHFIIGAIIIATGLYIAEHKKRQKS